MNVRAPCGSVRVDQPARRDQQRHAPGVVERRRLRQRDLADDLRPHVQRGVGVLPLVVWQGRPLFVFGHHDRALRLCQNDAMRKMTVLAPSVALAIALIALTITAGAQSRDRAQTPDKFKWNLADIYPSDAAWRAAKDKLAARPAEAAPVPGQAGLVGRRRSPTRSRSRSALRQGAVAPVRLREPARRSGHARRRAPGHAAGDDAARRRVRRARRRSSSRRSCKAGQATIETLRRLRAAAEGLRASTSTTSPAARRTR